MSDRTDWTPEKIAAERAICDAATPGEWEWEDWSDDHGLDKFTLTSPPETAESGPSEMFPDLRNKLMTDEDREISNDDRAFIAAARTGYPSALDEIEARGKEIERLRGENQDLSDRNHRINRPRCWGMDEEETGDPCQFCGATVERDACRDQTDTAHLHAEIEREAARIAEMQKLAAMQHDCLTAREAITKVDSARIGRLEGLLRDTLALIQAISPDAVGRDVDAKIRRHEAKIRTEWKESEHG